MAEPWRSLFLFELCLSKQWWLPKPFFRFRELWLPPWPLSSDTLEGESGPLAHACQQGAG